MNFFDCVGDRQAWAIIGSYAAIIVLYWCISIFRFVPAAINARTLSAQIAWWSIAIIFPLCATSGYGSTVLAGWFPDIAYPLKEAMAYLDVLFCCCFLYATNRQQFELISKDSIRDEIRELSEKEKDPVELLRQIKEML